MFQIDSLLFFFNSLFFSIFLFIYLIWFCLHLLVFVWIDQFCDESEIFSCFHYFVFNILFVYQKVKDDNKVVAK